MFDIYIHNHFLKTPLGNPFQVPTLELVRAIEEEWERDPSPEYQKKPITSLTASALDRVPYSREAYTKFISRAVIEDVVLFWVESPEAVVHQQEKNWEPVIKTVNQRLGLFLKPVTTLSVKVLSQTEQTTINSLLERFTDFKLVGFSHLISLTESFCLSYLVQQGELSADKAWDLAHLHEHTQRKLWGNDKEEITLELAQRTEFFETARFLKLID